MRSSASLAGVRKLLCMPGEGAEAAVSSEPRGSSQAWPLVPQDGGARYPRSAIAIMNPGRLLPPAGIRPFLQPSGSGQRSQGSLQGPTCLALPGPLASSPTITPNTLSWILLGPCPKLFPLLQESTQQHPSPPPSGRPHACACGHKN